MHKSATEPVKINHTVSHKIIFLNPTPAKIIYTMKGKLYLEVLSDNKWILLIETFTIVKFTFI